MSREIDRSWESLLNPGKATDYFIDDAPPLEDDGTEWSPARAYWTAELSRAVYRDDERASFFGLGGFTEEAFYDRNGTQCATVRAANGEVFVVFRGTSQLRDWLTNLRAAPVDWSTGGRVHRGFAMALHEVWDAISDRLESNDTPYHYTGHSLGGAHAILATSLRPARTTYTFGAPRVGDATFTQSLPTTIYSVAHGRDLVPSLPPSLADWEFRDSGQRVHIPSNDPIPGEAEAELAPERITEMNDTGRWFDPHPSLSDHAPVNYVTALLGEWGR